MSNSAYWKGQYNTLMANQPKSSGSYYNQSFVDRMNEARSEVDGLTNERDSYEARANQSKDEYDAFSGTMRNYSDVYKNAENEFGVANAKNDYEKSKKALAMTQSALDALPSSINASSNRVLTQSQREARYNAMADKYNAIATSQTNQSSMYEQVWKNARENQSAYAKAEVASQYAKLGDYSNAWILAMNEYNNAANRLQSAKLNSSTLTADYRLWQSRQWANSYNVWYTNLNNALTRYLEELSNERAELLYRKESSTEEIKAKYMSGLGDKIRNNWFRINENR